MVTGRRPPSPDRALARLAESGHCPMTDQPRELAAALRGYAQR